MVAHDVVDYRASEWGNRFHFQRDANNRVIDEVLGAGSSGPGKCLDVDTLIPTPNGLVRMGDLDVGGQVYAPDGTPCNIIGVSPVWHDHDCYEVVFDGGASIVADAEHLWFTHDFQERCSLKNMLKRAAGRTGLNDQRHKRRMPRVRTTEEIRATLKTSHCQGNHAIRVPEPCEGTVAELPLAPYLLGAWLGDGTTRSAEITTEDETIIEAFRAAGMVTSYEYPSGNSKTYGVKGLHRPLRMAGLLGNKHIPETYFAAPVAARLALLQGLVDTDGHVDRDGRVEFCSCRERLATDVYRLVSSLGLKATMKESDATLKGRVVGRRWRICWHPNGMVPCRLERKKKNLRPGRDDRLNWRYIREVNPVPTRPVRCIMVDHPSRLFLAGVEHIPTHNTEAMLWDVCLQMQREEARQRLPKDHPHYVPRGGSKGRGLLLRRSSPMLRDLRKRGLFIFRKLNDGVDGWSATNSTFTFKCGYEITLGHCYERDDVENYVGVSWSWLGFDELIQFLAEQYHTIKLWMRSYDPVLAQDLRVRAASNPVFLRKNSEDFEVEDPFWVRRYFVDPFPQGNRVLVDTKFDTGNIAYGSGDLVRARVDSEDAEICTVLETDGDRYRLAKGDARGKDAVESVWVGHSNLSGKFYERTRMYMPATIDDNPDPNYRESQRRNLLSAPRHIREALLKGNWYHQTGGYFEAVWNPDIHVVKPYAIPRDWKIWRSTDWGFKTTGVVHWYAMDQDENVVVFMEYTFKGKTADYVAEKIVDRERQLGLVHRKRSLLTGPADTQLWEQRGDNAPTKAATMMRLGVPWRPATKDRQANAEYVYKRLGDHDDFKTTPGLTVFATCTETIKYAFNIMTDPKEPNVPKKGGNDHHYDSISYGVRFAQKGSAAIPAHSSVRKALEKGSDNDHDARGKDGYGG